MLLDSLSKICLAVNKSLSLLLSSTVSFDVSGFVVESSFISNLSSDSSNLALHDCVGFLAHCLLGSDSISCVSAGLNIDPVASYLLSLVDTSMSPGRMSILYCLSADLLANPLGISSVSCELTVSLIGS